MNESPTLHWKPSCPVYKMDPFILLTKGQCKRLVFKQNTLLDHKDTQLDHKDTQLDHKDTRYFFNMFYFFISFYTHHLNISFFLSLSLSCVCLFVCSFILINRFHGSLLVKQQPKPMTFQPIPSVLLKLVLMNGQCIGKAVQSVE